MSRSSLPVADPSPAIMVHPADRTATALQGDDWLVERIRRELCRTGHGDLYCIAVMANRQWVELDGHVPTFYLKQVAQEVVRRIAPAHQIHNQLRVGAAPPGRGKPR